MSIVEKRKVIALNTFKGTYPNITSGDLQAFILGMKAMENIFKDIELEDLQNESELNALENQTYEG